MFEWKREAKNSEKDVMRAYDYHMPALLSISFSS